MKGTDNTIIEKKMKLENDTRYPTLDGSAQKRTMCVTGQFLLQEYTAFPRKDNIIEHIKSSDVLPIKQFLKKKRHSDHSENNKRAYKIQRGDLPV